MTARTALAAILSVGVLCRLAFLCLTPVFYAPDEHSHFNYIKYLSERGTFPVQTTKMGDPANEWEYFQPPLYYVALIPIYRAAQAIFHEQTATVFALRFVSLLLWLINLRLGLHWLRQLEIKDVPLRLTALSFLCLLPTYVFISSVVNNDNLLATLGGSVVCLLTRREQTVISAMWLGVLFGLALLVKQSALVLAPAIVLTPLLYSWKNREKLAPALLRGAVAIALGAAIYFPWALRNLRVYGTFFPEQLSAVSKTWPSTAYGLASAIHNLIKSFWSVSGIANDIGYPFAAIGIVFMLLSFFGLFLELTGVQRRRALSGHPQFPLFASLTVAIAINVCLVLRFGYVNGMGQGRHMFVLLFPVALIIAVGSRSLALQNSAARVTGFWMTYSVAFTIFSLSRFPH
jgi:hypothetical protein